jgi:hypothetical protein
MATWDDVRRIALALPEVTETTRWGTAAWCVKTKAFVWERPLRKADLAALGDRAPAGDILGVRVADLGVKEALLADDPEVYFTTPHFNGYPAVLLLLANASVEDLEEVVPEAWLCQAPKRLANDYLGTTSP